jgi:hypothetical protein
MGKEAGIFRTLVGIVRKESFAGLYKGMASPLVGVAAMK